MASDKLEVVPPVLRAASGTITGYGAQVASPAGTSGTSAEVSGLGAAAMDVALDEYCAAFSRRLSSASAALVGTADSFTAMEDANSAALASITPVR